MSDVLAPESEAAFDQGYEAAWEAYEPNQPSGDPIGVDEDYQFGWWVGVGEASAWYEGWEAAEKGVLACPYAEGSDEEDFRGMWLEGYGDAFLSRSLDENFRVQAARIH